MAQYISLETREFLNDLINKSRFRNLKGEAREAKTQEMYHDLTGRIIAWWLSSLSPADHQTVTRMQQDSRYTGHQIIDLVEAHVPDKDRVRQHAVDAYAEEFVRS